METVGELPNKSIHAKCERLAGRRSGGISADQTARGVIDVTRMFVVVAIHAPVATFNGPAMVDRARNAPVPCTAQSSEARQGCASVLGPGADPCLPNMNKQAR